MLIPMPILSAIAAGEVTLAFRRWDRARVKPGTRLRTAIGLVEVTSVEQVALSTITAEQARQAGSPTRQALLEFLKRKPQGVVFRIGLRPAGADPRIALRGDDNLSDVDLAAILGRLDMMDSASDRKRWTLTFLRLIAQRPAVRAPELAESLGWDTPTFKRYVRKLKELGLTESLDIGYRLSPRGQVVLAAAQHP